MGSLVTRIRRLEKKLPACRQDDDFDVERALSFRIAGLLHSVVQARVILTLDALANRRGCPPDVQEECRAQILAVIPAFERELLRDLDDPRRQASRAELEAAKALVRKYAASAPSGSTNQRGPTSRG